MIERPNWGEPAANVPASPATTKPAEARPPVPARAIPAPAGGDEIDDAALEAEVDEEDARRDAEMERLGIAPPAGQVKAAERAPSLAAVERELRDIDQRRRSDLATYFRGPDPARELELLEMRERLQGGQTNAAADEGKRSEVAAIDKELAEILQRVMRSDRPRYERELASRHLELLAQKEQLKLGSTGGLPPEVLAEWRNTGGVEHHLKVAQDTARVAFDALEGQELAEFQQSFDALPEAVIAGVYRHIGTEPGFSKPATEAAVTEFAGLSEVHGEFVASLGHEAPKLLGRAKDRMSSILAGMKPGDRQQAIDYLDNLKPVVAVAVIRGLIGRKR